jgi:hypothetical protein
MIAGCYDQLMGINKNSDEQPIPTLAHLKQEVALSYFSFFFFFAGTPLAIFADGLPGGFFLAASFSVLV